MKRSTIFSRFIIFMLVGSQMFFSSCLEIIEKISIHDNKSGTVSYSLQAQDGGSIFSSLTSLFSMSVENEVRREADKLIGELLKQPGISNVKYNLSGSSASYYLQFDFSDYKSFNNALYAISGNKKTFFSPGYLKVTNSRFKKLNFSPYIKKYLERENVEFPSPLITEMIYFKSVVQVPGAIRRVKPSGKTTKLDSQQATQRFKLSEIMENKVDTGLKIRY